jgi:hypothetical protein
MLYIVQVPAASVFIFWQFPKCNSHRTQGLVCAPWIKAVVYILKAATLTVAQRAWRARVAG